MTIDPYKLLGLEPLTPLDEVKKAYRRLAKSYHPDYNKNDPKASSKFQTVTEAYDIITSGKYNPEHYRPVLKTTSSPPLRFHITINMKASYTGGHVNYLPCGPYWLKPGSIGGDVLIITPYNQGIPPFGLTIVYNEQKDFTHVKYDLYTKMIVTKKQLKKKVSFIIPNHPNPNAGKVIFPQNIKNGKTAKVTGQGLPMGEGTYGDLYITVTIPPSHRFMALYIPGIIWLMLVLWFLYVAFISK